VDLIKSYKTEKVVLMIIVLAGVFFRFYHYTGFSLSNDELSAVNRLHFSNISELINKGVRPDGHPAGVQVLLYLWTKAFGLSPASIRFPFVLISSFAPFLGFLFVRKIFGSAPALFTAVALAFSGFPVLYGQIARPYGIGLSFTLLTAWLWSEVVFSVEKNKTGKVITAGALAFSSALCLYTHYFAALNAVVFGLSGFFFLNKGNWKYYIGAALGTLVLFLPHFSITLHQISLGGVGQWLAKPSYSWPGEHILFIFNKSPVMLVAVIVLIFIASLLDRKGFNKDIRFRALTFTWFLLPMVVGFYYSRHVDPVLQNSVLIFSMPFLWAFLFSFVPSALSKTNVIILLVFSVFLSLNTFVFSSYYKTQHFGAFKGIAGILAEWQKQHDDKDVLTLAEVNNLSYLKYYNRHLNIAPTHHFKDEKDLMALRGILDTTKAKFIAFADPQDIANPLALNMIEAQFSHLIKVIKFGDKSSIYLFEKGKSLPLFPDHIFYKTPGSLTTSEEYCCSRSLQINKWQKDSIEVWVRAKTEDTTTQSKAQWVVTFQNGRGKTTAWYSSPFYLFKEGYIVFHRKLKVPSGSTLLKTYCWNPGKEKLKIKLVEILIY